MVSSQLAPPKAIVASGRAFFTRPARASEATFWWNTDVKPTNVCSSRTWDRLCCRKVSTCSRIRRSLEDVGIAELPDAVQHVLDVALVGLRVRAV